MNVKLGKTEWDAKVLADVIHYGACQATKFHDQAYIWSVWETLFEQDMIKGSFTSFQKAILELHKHGFIRVTRADLVRAMDQEMVRKSTTLHPTGTAEFHFISAEHC